MAPDLETAPRAPAGTPPATRPCRCRPGRFVSSSWAYVRKTKPAGPPASPRRRRTFPTRPGSPSQQNPCRVLVYALTVLRLAAACVLARVTGPGHFLSGPECRACGLQGVGLCRPYRLRYRLILRSWRRAALTPELTGLAGLQPRSVDRSWRLAGGPRLADSRVILTEPSNNPATHSPGTRHAVSLNTWRVPCGIAGQR